MPRFETHEEAHARKTEARRRRNYGRALTVACPKCSAAGGAWCTFAGLNALVLDLPHHERQERAATPAPT